jgi:hypothetical protein
MILENYGHSPDFDLSIKLQLKNGGWRVKDGGGKWEEG